MFRSLEIFKHAMQTYRDVKLPCQRVYDMYFRAAGNPPNHLSLPTIQKHLNEVQDKLKLDPYRRGKMIMKLNHTSDDSRVSSKSII